MLADLPEDLTLALPVAQPPALARHAVHLGHGDEALFAWYHECEHAAATHDAVAVICPPIGPEYTRSHRSVRHLADRLAAAGIPALRFDYQGCGDSPGSDQEPERLARWRASVANAVRHARAVSGRDKVCLIGIRLGATLAALEGPGCGVDRLVLWNPVVKGRAYTRELQVIAMTSEDACGGTDNGFEAAGFRIAPETLAALRSIDLSRAQLLPGTRVLFATRDDIAPDTALPAHLVASGVDCETAALPGWNGMMADHQFTEVPDAALEKIVTWVMQAAAGEPAADRHAKSGVIEMARHRARGNAATARGPLSDGPLELSDALETPHHFGPDSRLFGILTRPRGGGGGRAIVMLNAGSIHHVGPHGLYVRLARAAASLGCTSLRFDFEGLGDSILRSPGEENEPYPDWALENLRAAVDFVRAQGCSEVILLGVCSGAQTAFQAGHEMPELAVDRLVLVNPWYFYRTKGATYDPRSHHYRDVAAYGKSMRDGSRWKRLLRGEVDLVRAARVATTHAARSARAAAAGLHEAIDPEGGTRLSRDLRTVLANGARITMIEGEGEPAGAALRTEARRALRKACRSGAMTIERIAGGDHTFSRLAARDELVRRICAVLRGDSGGVG